MIYLLVLGLPFPLSTAWGSGTNFLIELPSVLEKEESLRPMMTKKLLGLGHLSWWYFSAGSAHPTSMPGTFNIVGSFVCIFPRL